MRQVSGTTGWQDPLTGFRRPTWWQSCVKHLCVKCGIAPPIFAYELRHTAITMQADWVSPAGRFHTGRAPLGR